MKSAWEEVPQLILPCRSAKPPVCSRRHVILLSLRWGNEGRCEERGRGVTKGDDLGLLVCGMEGGLCTLCYWMNFILPFSYGNWMPVMPFFWNIMLFLPFLHIFGAGSRNGLILIFDSRVLRIWCLQLPQRQIHSTSLNTCWHQNWDLCSKTSKNVKHFQDCKKMAFWIFPQLFCSLFRKNKDIIRDISSCVPRKR